MKYISTRGRIEPVDFQDAVMMGLADDGGLIIPQEITDISDRLEELAGLDYPHLAFEVIKRFATDIHEGELKELVLRTYDEAFTGGVAPTVPVGDIFIQELWHGPTLAFKDVALQFLGNLFEYILARRGGCLNIVGATSGDTGSAAIYGVRGRDGINIFVMHPHGRVSPIQQRQMTTVLDENVHNIALEGSFDDCQSIMKGLAGDLEFKRKYSLGAVNSVNWARVLAQIVYYFWGYFEVQRQLGRTGVSFSVPTGNFGDVLAGWFAKKMGLPINKLILATNENDILARFFNTGEYSLGKVFHTLSPSMDIQVASNFERYLYYKVGCDSDKLRDMMEDFAKTGSLRVEFDGQVDEDFISAAADESAVLAAIKKYKQDENYLLDPHTACGVAVAEKCSPADDKVVCLATAHPAKFPDAIEKATGDASEATHEKISHLAEMETRFTVLPNDQQAVKEFIIEELEK